MNQIIVTVLILSPLIGMLLILLTNSQQEQQLKRMGVLGALIPLIISLWMVALFDFNQPGYQLTQEAPWFQFSLPGGEGVLSITYAVGVDGLSVAMMLLVTILSVMAAIASSYITARLKEYFLLFFLLEIGMLGVFGSLNLFLFFIFFEITIISAFFLIGIWGYVERERAAYHFLLYNGIGSVAMLVAFVMIFMKVGSLSLPELASAFSNTALAPWFSSAVFLLLLFAFGVKLPIFPLHSWMLRVHVEAHPAIVMIHAGVLLKLGAYGLIRLNAGLLPAELERFSLFIAVLGAINILYGAVLAFRQRDIKRVLAYASLSHMGIVLLGIAAQNESGLTGAVFQSISHGLISALLFFIVAVLYARTKTTMLDELGGLAKTMPLLCGFLMAAGMANLGLPGMSGFISEFLAFLGIFNTYPAVGAASLLGLILTAVYMLRAVLATSFGPLAEKWSGLTDIRGFEWIPLVVLTALIIVIGIYPAVLGDTIRLAVESVGHGLLTRMGG